MTGILWASLALATAPAKPIVRPRLVVVVSIDQFRADYTRRFAPYYLPPTTNGKPGGFRYLMETGADYADAHHAHIPTATGPGHATLLSGAEPCVDGIIGNDWMDLVSGKEVYCVDDASVKVVGGGATKPMSPKNLKVTTVGDELKMATNGRAKVVSVSFKDRAAILMSGHASDAVIWFDANEGRWVSSSFYCKSGQLPQWVSDWNGQDIPKKTIGQKWTPLLAPKDYEFTRVSPTLQKSSNTLPFEHLIDGVPGKRGAFNNFTMSAQGQKYVFDTAKQAVAKEDMGKDDVPDLLTINLATNDYVGHAYGPNSPEVMDISVQTDRLLSDFLGYLDHQVTGGLDSVVFVVTADHGVVPIPEESADVFGTGVERNEDSKFGDDVDAQLSQTYGPGKYVLYTGEPNWYLDRNLIAQKHLKIEEVRTAAAAAIMKLPGQYEAFTRDDILSGKLPRWDWVRLVTNGYHPSLGGDLMVISGPGNYAGGGTGTGHGTPWFYDSHVPIIFHGPGITPGFYPRSVETTDIAPTLSILLGIEAPTGCTGHLLQEALTPKR